MSRDQNNRSRDRGADGYHTRSFSGSSGWDEADRAESSAKARREVRKATMGQARRFFLSPGRQTTYVIVDDEPKFFRWEYALENPADNNRRTLFLPANGEHDDGPIKRKFPNERPYYAMMLTIIDETEYTAADGRKVKWSKKLLAVKSAQIKFFRRYFDRYGTLRGLRIQVERDGDREAAIGTPVDVLEELSDRDLEDFYDEYKSDSGKMIEVDGSVPFDYAEMFPDMTEDQILVAIGGAPASGRVGARDADTPRRRSRDDDEAPRRRSRDDDEAPRRRSRDEDDDAPRRRSRDDDEAPRRSRDDDEAPRRRSRDEDEDAPRRRNRDDDEAPRRSRDDDEAPRRSRDDDEAPRRRSRDEDEAPRRRSRDEDEAPRRSSRDEDEAPRRRSRDEDEAPRRRSRDEDEAPRRRSRDDDEDAPGTHITVQGDEVEPGDDDHGMNSDGGLEADERRERAELDSRRTRRSRGREESADDKPPFDTDEDKTDVRSQRAAARRSR